MFCVIGLAGMLLPPGYLPHVFAVSKLSGLLRACVFALPLAMALRRRPLEVGHAMIAFGAALYGFLMFGLADVVPHLTQLSVAVLLMTIGAVGGGVSAALAIVKPEDLRAPAH